MQAPMATGVGHMSRCMLVAILVLTAGQISQISAQDAGRMNVTDAPKILLGTVGFMESVPEDERDSFQADFAALLESLSDGAIDQENVTFSRFKTAAENRTTIDIEIYFTDPEDAFAAKNLLKTPQIGLKFQELGAGSALFFDVNVHEASDVNSDDEVFVAVVLGVLLGLVVLLCIANLFVVACICKMRRSRRSSAPIPRPDSEPTTPKGPSATPETQVDQTKEPKKKKSFSFGRRSAKGAGDEGPPADEKPAQAKKGWFGRKKKGSEQLIADEEAPTAASPAVAGGEADAPAPDSTPPGPETFGKFPSP